MAKRYKINEIFYSIQGEGFYTGTPAVFIRFSGCNLRCPFCDTQHERGTFYEAADILQEIDKVSEGSRPKLVVLTGGEPTLVVDADLTAALAQRFKIVAMESNGTRPVPDGVSFLTVSPKKDFTEGGEVLVTECDELKLVYTGENNPRGWYEKINAKHYYLQPCDTGDPKENEKILAATLDYIKRNPWWRLSLQTQKIIKVR